MKIILIIILCFLFYIIGKEDGKEEATKLVKRYWEESKDINEFLFKFTVMWNKNVGDKEDKDERRNKMV